MQPFQDEYLRAKKSAFEAIASLQRLSLEVQEQRMAAIAELEGLGFHERFICVRNEWLRQFRACCAEAGARPYRFAAIHVSRKQWSSQ